MKRLLTSMLLASLCAVNVSAAPVTRESAMKVAEDFIAARFGARRLSESPKRIIEQSATSVNPTNSTYHIFNIENNGGFVIVSGDTRTRSILAYGDEGNMNDDNIPDACRYWLDFYSEEISSLSVAEGVTETMESNGDAIGPLLKSRWDQKYPYNILCPVTQNGLRCLTGCVATAMAQVMNYHEYPSRATGSVTYTDNKQKVERTFDFDAEPAFSWDKICDIYDYTQTEAQCNAVARLMVAAGHAARMQYAPEESNAFQMVAANAMIKHFGYDGNMRYYERNMMPAKEWESKILTELQAGRPVIYCGSNPSGAHCFVCDGYDGAGFFHFNWGWGGQSDGYYAMSALTPGEQGSGGSDGGYTSGQNAICNIAPAGKAASDMENDYLIAADKIYYRDASSYHEAEDVTELATTMDAAHLFFYCFNNSFADFLGDVVAAVIDGNEIRPVITAETGNIASGEHAPASFPLANSGLADGTYEIGFFYRLNASDKWHPVKSHYESPEFCRIKVAGNDVVISPLDRTEGIGSGLIGNVVKDATITMREGMLTVASEHGIRKVTLHGLDGSAMSEKIQGGETVSFDIHALNHGIYVLRIETSESIISRKIIL